MSVTNREAMVKLYKERRPFPGIREIGFNTRGEFIISLWTTPNSGPGLPRGSYFTTIPISPADYRARYPDNPAAFEATRYTITITDDWGKQHHITTEPDIIASLAAECEASGLARAGREGRG